MAEVKAVPAKKIVRKRAGYRRVMVTLTEERAKVLDELAAADMRQGGATEILSVMVARNFDALVRTVSPAQMSFGSQAVITGNAEKYRIAEVAEGSKNRDRDYLHDMQVAAKQEAASIRTPAVTLLASEPE